MSPDPIARRDAGLRRVSGVTKGVLAAGVALTGVVSAVAAHSFSGTSTSTAAAQTTQSTTQSTTATTTATTQLQSPTYSVQSSSGSSRVSSGGS